MSTQTSFRAKGGKGGKGGGRGGGRGYGISSSELGTFAFAIFHMREQDLDQIESLITARRLVLADIRGKAADAGDEATDGVRKDGDGGKLAKKQRKKSDSKKMWNDPLLLEIPYFKLVAEDTDKKFRTLPPSVTAMATVGAYLIRADKAKISEEAKKLDLNLACKLKDGENAPDSGIIRWLDGLYRNVKVTESSVEGLNREQISAAKTIEKVEAISATIKSPVDAGEVTKTLFVHPQISMVGDKRTRAAAGISEEVYGEYLTKRFAAGAVSCIDEIIID